MVGPAARRHPRTSVPPARTGPAHPGAGVLTAIGDADVVLLAPSNPVVSIGTICGFPAAEGFAPGPAGVPGIAEALRRTAAPVVGVSPIIDAAPLRGMARQCLESLGHPCSALAVGLGYGARRNGGLLDAWLVDDVDGDSLGPLRAAGLQAAAVPLWMTDPATSEALAADALALAGLR